MLQNRPASESISAHLVVTKKRKVRASSLKERAAQKSNETPKKRDPLSLETNEVRKANKKKPLAERENLG